MAAERSYSQPAAFRRALTDRLRNLAETSRWSLAELQRQIAYDRVLQRLDDGSWIVKGAAALMARDIAVRATIDVDLFRSTALEVSEADFRAAVQQDIGDWFQFEIGPGRALSAGTSGIRLPATAFIGMTEWCTFHVDLVGPEVQMTGSPDQMPPLARLTMPDIEQASYRVYPLVDHIADKVAAILQTYGPEQTVSTRYKDLVDLVAIVSKVSVEAGAQQAAFKSEAIRRGLTLPKSFGVPDRVLWQSGYSAEATRSQLTVGLALDDALAIVGPFLNPLLNGSASGTWEPSRGCWVG